MKRKLDTNKHSVFLLYYHLVLVTKYRKRVLNEEISLRLKEIFISISKHYFISLEEWNSEEEHIHILMKSHPKSEISKCITAYKSASSRLIKKEFPYIKTKLWKEFFWSRSFCLLTTGGVSIEVIREYIETQGEKKK